MRFTFLFAVLFTLMACNGLYEKEHPNEDPMKAKPLTGQCKDPRPKVCTMQYEPVCGLNMDGNHQDYPSPCSACGNSAVVSWTKGNCNQPMQATPEE